MIKILKTCSSCKIDRELDQFNKDKSATDGLKYSCRECTKKRYSIYYESNKEREIERQTNYQNNNKSSVNKRRCSRHKERYATDLLYKLKYNTRNRIKMFLKSSNFNKIKSGTFNIVGCTPIELKDYIEKQFTDNMNWGNYSLKGWHIDHKIPLVLATNEEEVYKLCHYTNLQPMWAEDNLKKGVSI